MVQRIQVWQVCAALILLLAISAAMSALYNVSRAADDVVAARKGRMFQPQPKGDQARFQRAVLSTPLEADLLHGLIAHRVAERKARVMTEPERKALLSLGWRSTLVQTALLADSVARSDESLALSRIDGLLRRGVNRPELLSVMIQLEQAGPAPRREIVQMLRAKPSWRTDFLGLPAGYSTTAGLLARAETLDAMFKQRLAPQHFEVAPIVDGLEASGAPARAERLWGQYNRLGAGAPLPFDPKFVVMATHQSDERYRPMIYEWRGGQGAGYSVRADLIDVDNAVLTIRWDGRGAPVLLRQTLVAAPGRFVVTVKGSLVDRSTLNRLAFVFYCRGAPPVFYDRLSQGGDGSFDFTANEPVPCRNPEIRLVGISEEGMVPLELQLTTIGISRASTP